MIVAKSMDVRDNFKSWCGQVANGETVRIIRPGNNCIYMINQETYEKIATQNRLNAYVSYLNGKDKITNLKRLSEIEKLQENWNQNGAKRISEVIIKNVRRLILSFKNQPEVFPTACDAVQLEWDKKNGEYLEMEVLEDRINLFQIDVDGSEVQRTISFDEAVINEIIKEFYEK